MSFVVGTDIYVSQWGSGEALVYCTGDGSDCQFAGVYSELSVAGEYYSNVLCQAIAPCVFVGVSLL